MSVVARARPWPVRCTVQFCGEVLATCRVDGAGFRNDMKVPRCQHSHLCLRVPASVGPADARLSRGQRYRAVLCVSVCELAEWALELNLAACEVVNNLSLCSICISVACLGFICRLTYQCARVMRISKFMFNGFVL
jgi:hypothetical protein